MPSDDPPAGRVLVVEDQYDLAELYGDWISERHDVDVAYSGPEAFDALEETFDVVLLDRRLPQTSGDEILDWIRENDLECAVAMVSAVDPDFDVHQMGFDDYVVKPVSQNELLDLVDRLLRRAEYDTKIRRLFSLASKIAALQTHKTETELEGNETYETLCAERNRLDEELDMAVGEFSEDEVGALLQTAR